MDKWFRNRIRGFASGHTGKMAASMAAAICTKTDSHVTTDSHVGNKGSWAFPDASRNKSRTTLYAYSLLFE